MEKLERREGVPLGLKGERQLQGKTSLERRGPIWPGQHAHGRRRKTTVYGEQLRETQKLKIYYGVREKQFRRYVGAAQRRRDITTGEALLELLERRLDNVVYRLGLANTRAQARQFVSHGHIVVDGRRATIASMRVKDGQTVGLLAGAPVTPLVQEAVDTVGRVPGWLQADHDKLEGKLLRSPRRDEITTPVTVQLVVERYARR